MDSVDFSDPQQVFDRLAQLQHESTARQATIEGLDHQQRAADEEFDHLERAALAYLDFVPDSVVKAKASNGRYSWEQVEYQVAEDAGAVVVKRVQSVLNMPSLTPEQIAAAFGEDTPGDAAERLMDEDIETSVLAENFHPWPTLTEGA